MFRLEKIGTYGNYEKTVRDKKKDLIKKQNNSCPEPNHSEQILINREICRRLNFHDIEITIEGRGKDSVVYELCKNCDYVKWTQKYGYDYEGFIHTDCIRNFET